MTSNALSCVRIRKEDTTVNVILDLIWKPMVSHVQVNKVAIKAQYNGYRSTIRIT